MSSHFPAFTLAALTSNILVLSAPVHPLFPTIPLLLPLHAARVAIAWEQVRSSKRGKGVQQRGMKDLVGYLVMAFGGSTLTSFLLRSPPSWLISPVLLPLYTLIYLLLPTRSVILRYIPSLPLNFLLALLDAVNRLLSFSTLVANPTFRSFNTSGNVLGGGAWSTFLLAGLGTVGGGLLAGMFGLWEDDWTFSTPALLRSLGGEEGWEGIIWGGMDFWSAGGVAVLFSELLRDGGADASRFVASFFGLQNEGFARGSGKGWASLEARVICTVVLAAFLGTRVVVLYSKAWWGHVRGLEDGARKAAEERREKVVEIGDVVAATTSSVEVDGPRKSGKAKQRHAGGSAAGAGGKKRS